MAEDYSKWWNKFKYKADIIVGKRSHYYKEKYGGFRVELYEGGNKELLYKLDELEEESYQYCQKCAKHRKQYRTETGWIEHFCLPCYIKVLIKYYKRIFIYKIKRIWGKIKSKGMREYQN